MNGNLVVVDDAARSSGSGEPSGPAIPPELLAALDRAQHHADALRGTAAELRAVLPTRVEAAVARALGDERGDGSSRRIGDMARTLSQTAETVQATSEDIRRERLARVQDLETLVDLIAAGHSAMRRDVAAIERRLDAISGLVAQLAVQTSSLLAAQHEVRARLEAPIHLSVTADRLPPA